MELIRETYYNTVGTDELTQTEHSHKDTYELIQILGGEGEFIINNKAYHFKKGAVFLIDAENFHYSAPQDPKTYIRNKLIINKTMLLEVARSLGFYEQITSMFNGSKDNSVYLEKKNALAVNELFEIISNNREPLECAGAFINMINILWENTHSPVWQDEMLSVIFEAINNHIGDEFSLDILSSETNTDKYYLCHYFKSKTGMTIFDYLKCQRIEMAKKLLVENNTSISQIANACGYNSLAYFSKCFKEATGMTPKEYVKSVL